MVVGFSLALSASANKSWFKQLLRSKLTWLVLAYTMLTVILALVRATDIDAEVVGLTYNLRFLVFAAHGLLLTNLFDSKKLQRTAIYLLLLLSTSSC